VANLSEMQALRLALDKLGYTVLEKAKFMHFSRGTTKDMVEINLLTGLIEDDILKEKVQINRPRVRPKGKVELHAYLTEEAIDLSSNIEEFLLGDNGQIKIFLPLPFHFLLMKLHAFNDRTDDAEKQRTHALDVYRVIAMLTDLSYKVALKRSQQYADTPAVKNAVEIVKSHFSSKNSIGVIRIKEHQLHQESFEIETCIDVLKVEVVDSMISEFQPYQINDLPQHN